MAIASIVLAILAVGVLIIFHEAGHYFAAKWSGMRVSRFSIGFGPVIYKTGTRGETEFVVSLIPFGGYVAIDGMNPEDGTPHDDPAGYHAKPFFAKFGTILAGPVANYILAFLLFFGFFAFFYVEQMPPIRVTDIKAESAAAQAGLEEGDILIGTQDGPFEAFDDVRAVIQASEGEPIAFSVRREGETQMIQVQPEPVGGGYLIGIHYEGIETRSRPLGVVKGASVAAQKVVLATKNAFMGLAGLVTGQVGLGAVDGPIGIVKQLSDTAQRSAPGTLVMVAGLSVALGFFNLLPLPALDGGRLMFLLFAAVRRKPIEQRLESYIHVAGFLLLLGLILVVSVGDVFE
ncbi:MAG: M50 family metallopeptidase [Myxococcota bacterium]